MIRILRLLIRVPDEEILGPGATKQIAPVGREAHISLSLNAARTSTSWWETGELRRHHLLPRTECLQFSRECVEDEVAPAGGGKQQRCAVVGEFHLRPRGSCRLGGGEGEESVLQREYIERSKGSFVVVAQIVEEEGVG